MAEKKLKLSQLKPDSKNANKHTQHGTVLLNKSITDNGFGRSILLSADNVVIAGNGIAEGAKNKNPNLPVRVIETTGDELIAVKRMDINSGTDAFYTMALADNVVADRNISFDRDVVQSIAVDFDVLAWDKEIKPVEPGTNHTVRHSNSNSLTLKFDNAGTLAKVKAAIAKSGYTAEEFVLHTLKLK